MAIHDLRNLDLGTPLDADVCIVGSGPAGWTLSEELAATGLNIIVLESGGLLESGVVDRDPDCDALNDTDDVGVPLFNGRRRTLGGTAEAIPWGNRCIAFDPIDYEQRPWVPHSGWPIGAEDMAPYLDRASRHMGGGPYLPDGPKLPRGVAPPAVDPSLLKSVWWWFGRTADKRTVSYARNFRQRPHPNVRVLVHATVTHLDTNAAGSRIESVEVADPEGRRTRVTARAVVLCAGGIENARILLYSNRTVPRGLGNAHDLVGRYLMDHPRDLDFALRFDPRDGDRLQRLFGYHRFDAGDGPRDYAGGLALSPEVQRRRQLLNCAAWPVAEAAEDDPIWAAQRAAMRLLRRGDADLKRQLRHVAAQPVRLLRAAHAVLRTGQPMRHKYGKVGFLIGSEQVPDPDSRVMLGERTDRYGLPLVRTDWRVGQQDKDSQLALAQILQREFRRLSLPEPQVADWVRTGRHEEAVFCDGCHPTGTTRMARSPRDGVVDPDCQVHGVDGLYISSSSVFPTAGHANPTMMILAMSVRLAEHLQARLRVERGARTSAQLLPA